MSLPPHPILSLFRAGPPHDEEARRQLAALLALHGSVRATALALGRHETTIADWMTRMGVANPNPQPNARRATAPAPTGPAKRKSRKKKSKA
jgi:IS30 family transposase